MRKFNPEKELSKIRNGNKKKAIISICALLVVGVLGYSFALYQVRHTKSLVYTTVGDFKKRDIYLSVLVDGKTQGDFPKNNEGKIYSGIECDKPYSEAYFDNTEWKLHFTSDGPNKCTVKFETGNLPNAPELYQGMIPIVYGDNGLMYVADTSKDWYNYQDHRWANAVLVDASQANIKSKYFKEDNSLRDDIAGKEVPMEEVLQMYVWIPRYKYQLFNVAGTSKVLEQMINIKFEEETSSTGDITCKYTNNNDGTITESCLNKEGEKASNSEWYTHPAFTFKGTIEESGTELPGIWVGKFESSGTNSSNQITNLKIVPNVSSLRNVAVAYMFQGVRDLEEKHYAIYNINPIEIDTHMMKNMEWGAVAYLTQSKYGRFNSDGKEIKDGAEVWINNDSNYTTGCVGSSVSASAEICTATFSWNQDGVHASTTNNVSGIYDMSGGAVEYVMGNMVNNDGTFCSKNATFGNSSSVTLPNPDVKYYDMYAYGTDHKDMTRSHLGDASKETRMWYNDTDSFPYSSNCWVNRGVIIVEKQPQAPGIRTMFIWASTTILHFVLLSLPKIINIAI